MLLCLLSLLFGADLQPTPEQQLEQLKQLDGNRDQHHNILKIVSSLISHGDCFLIESAMTEILQKMKILREQRILFDSNSRSTGVSEQDASEEYKQFTFSSLLEELQKEAGKLPLTHYPRMVKFYYDLLAQYVCQACFNEQVQWIFSKLNGSEEICRNTLRFNCAFLLRHGDSTLITPVMKNLYSKFQQLVATTEPVIQDYAGCEEQTYGRLFIQYGDLTLIEPAMRYILGKLKNLSAKLHTEAVRYAEVIMDSGNPDWIATAFMAVLDKFKEISSLIRPLEEWSSYNAFTGMQHYLDFLQRHPDRTVLTRAITHLKSRLQVSIGEWDAYTIMQCINLIKKYQDDPTYVASIMEPIALRLQNSGEAKDSNVFSDFSLLVECSAHPRLFAQVIPQVLAELALPTNSHNPQNGEFFMQLIIRTGNLEFMRRALCNEMLRAEKGEHRGDLYLFNAFAKLLAESEQKAVVDSIIPDVFERLTRLPEESQSLAVMYANFLIKYDSPRFKEKSVRDIFGKFARVRAGESPFSGSINDYFSFIVQYCSQRIIMHGLKIVCQKIPGVLSSVKGDYKVWSYVYGFRDGFRALSHPHQFQRIVQLYHNPELGEFMACMAKRNSETFVLSSSLTVAWLACYFGKKQKIPLCHAAAKRIVEFLYPETPQFEKNHIDFLFPSEVTVRPYTYPGEKRFQDM